jgi:hypothetical protein
VSRFNDEHGSVIEVQIPSIRSTITYATALYEIGHILGRYQKSRSIMVRERWAWEWARSAGRVWTPAMERCATKSPAWYVKRNPDYHRPRL